MITIQPLITLDSDDIRRLNVGYTSLSRYAVRKVETPDRTQITLRLVNLDQPYIKRWETTGEDLQRYQKIVQEGFSLGAYDGEQMVGIALAEPRFWNRSLWVWEFHVDNTYRRQGVGRTLMEDLIERAARADLRVLVCETQNTNVPAIQFYRSLGFEIEGVDLSYYTNLDVAIGEVAIFMKRKIK